MKEFKSLSVSPEFERIIKKKYQEFNRGISQKYYGKNISFISYTELIAPSISQIGTIQVNEPFKLKTKLEEMKI